MPPDVTHLDQCVYINSDEIARNWKPVGVNPHIRIYKYDPKQRIPKHMDYRMRRTVWRGGKQYRQMTFTTLLIYLNDDFKNGETGYWADFDTGDMGTNRKRYCNFVNECGTVNDDHDIVVKPETGKALITDHCLFHEGMPPKQGTKYVIRTDIVHEREIEVHPRILQSMSDRDKADHATEWETLFETSCKNYAD